MFVIGKMNVIFFQEKCGNGSHHPIYYFGLLTALSALWGLAVPREQQIDTQSTVFRISTTRMMTVADRPHRVGPLGPPTH